MITVKIDVTKIDKALLFKGAKGTYLDVVLFETPEDKFGNDYRVVQGVTKEARGNTSTHYFNKYIDNETNTK